MKVLHLLSNYKWTGPAEPSVNLAAALANPPKADGAEVMFAPGADSKGRSMVAEHCARRGLGCVKGLRLGKHRRLLANRRDCARLAEIIEREKFDILHTHLDNDHRIALRALEKTEHRPVLVRSIYDGLPPVSLPGAADALFVISKRVGEWLAKKRRRKYPQVFLLDGSIDVDRFAPRPKDRKLAVKLGIEPGDVVVGIVARMQTHRRFHVLIEAFARAAVAAPNLKLMIVGRGTNADKVARKPAEELRVLDRVIFAGYRAEDFVSVANCMDFKVFLVPGSDGSCRAVRECMALGKPVIVAERGMLPEIVSNEADGLVIKDTVENLRAAIIRLARDRRLRLRMGRAGAEKAERFFDIGRQAQEVMTAYKFLIRRKGRSD